MTSGIYKLTFPNGETYIGKSVNMEERWQQHALSLEKGTAAKNMLRAKPRYGKFRIDCTKVLEVHPDLLDEYENYFINIFKPTLNTKIPTSRGDYGILEAWADCGYQVNSSTFAMSRALELEARVKGLEISTDMAVEELKEVQDRWDDKVYLEACANQLFQQQILQLRSMGRQIAELRKFKDVVDNCGWWGRLWKHWS